MPFTTPVKEQQLTGLTVGPVLRWMQRSAYFEEQDREEEEEEEERGGGGEARGWRESGTRMLMRVRRRKEEERENIDLRQENRRECNTGGLYPAWTIIRSEERE